MKVLIVDDVGYSRHYHSRMLQKFGMESLVAETGPQALRLLERDSTIDVVLTDLLMRDMDGLELFRAAQSIDRMNDAGNAEPPAFIMMTAVRPGSNAQPRDVEKLRVAKQIGFVDILFKPIDPEHLQRTFELVRTARGKAEVTLDLAPLVQRLREMSARIQETSDKPSASKLSEALKATLEQLAPLISAT